MNSFLFVNLLLLLSVVFRFLAIKITKILIATGDYIEGNPISRLLLKSKNGLYICHVILFVLMFISFNVMVLFYSEYNIMMNITTLIVFMLVFIDFLWNCICFKKWKKG